MEEILTFCSRYLENIETRWNRPRRVDDEPTHEESNPWLDTLFPQVGKPIGVSSYFTLTAIEKLQAHRHVLTNCSIVDKYLQEFRNIVRKQLRSRTRNTSEIDKKVHREFASWFSTRIVRDLDKIEESKRTVFFSLAKGPIDQARRFSAYNVNGYKFRTVEREKGLKTQNSGIFGTFGTRSYSRNSDPNMRFGAVPYYEKLVDIIELNYDGIFFVTLFKCEWANTTNPRAMKVDKLGFTSINFSRLIHTGEHEDDEPYIKANEAQMVYYVEDEKEKGWSIPIQVKPRDLYDIGNEDEDIIYDNVGYPSQDLGQFFQITFHMYH
nr:uncharacterized protein LOC112758623 [Arachis hypogaea]